MFFKRKRKPAAGDGAKPIFPHKRPPLWQMVKERSLGWLKDQSPLFEAVCVALSFHVLFFPVMWFMGWALPWPKVPIKTTIIEINLENWPIDATPEKITEILRTHMQKK